MIQNIVDRAKKMAIKDFLDHDQQGLRVAAPAPGLRGRVQGERGPARTPPTPTTGRGSPARRASGSSSSARSSPASRAPSRAARSTPSPTPASTSRACRRTSSSAPSSRRCWRRVASSVCGTTPSWSTGSPTGSSAPSRRGYAAEESDLGLGAAGRRSAAGKRQLALGIVSVVAGIPISAITLAVARRRRPASAAPAASPGAASSASTSRTRCQGAPAAPLDTRTPGTARPSERCPPRSRLRARVSSGPATAVSPSQQATPDRRSRRSATTQRVRPRIRWHQGQLAALRDAVRHAQQRAGDEYGQRRRAVRPSSSRVPGERLDREHLATGTQAIARACASTPTGSPMSCHGVEEAHQVVAAGVRRGVADVEVHAGRTRRPPRRPRSPAGSTPRGSRRRTNRGSPGSASASDDRGRPEAAVPTSTTRMPASSRSASAGMSRLRWQLGEQRVRWSGSEAPLPAATPRVRRESVLEEVQPRRPAAARGVPLSRRRGARRGSVQQGCHRRRARSRRDSAGSVEAAGRPSP